jgi:hypothetical protein
MVGRMNTIKAMTAEEIRIGDRIVWWGDVYDVDHAYTDGGTTTISMGCDDVPELELIQRPARGLVHVVVPG